MYVTRDQVNAVTEFLEARLREERAEHGTGPLTDALAAAICTGAAATTAVTNLADDADPTRAAVNTGLAGTGWDVLAEMARIWRSHPDYPEIADHNFSDLIIEVIEEHPRYVVDRDGQATATRRVRR
ncbi:hypothetical protein [Streptomyces sp. NRRL B-24484]|uniref:hypothetical protein n=1 Tax=Streptomyces sp. NRRL B-24484 TaxID=1463833 RepID=UPI0004C1F7F7|nr:hypothetical protein [Streptomyces sp. NRRL B-24484]